MAVTKTERQFLGYAEVGGEKKAVYHFQGYCVSSDTKPTGAEIGNGSSLVEMDTGKIYFFDAGAGQWREF